MISKAKIKFIHSLEQKKGRRETQCFVAEGPKVVSDLLPAFALRMLVATEHWLDANTAVASEYADRVEVVADDELRKCSFLQHPQQVLAVFEMPQDAETVNNDVAKSIGDDTVNGITLVLDSVQDPGNLGTIVRIADWFGIQNIVCSRETADVFNPKVVQATMGSIARVSVIYTDLSDYLKSLPAETNICGTFLDGDDITEKPLPEGPTVIIMGNEGNGISAEVERFVNRKMLIPNYPKGRATADSLNVAIATAITCCLFRFRR